MDLHKTRGAGSLTGVILLRPFQVLATALLGIFLMASVPAAAHQVETVEFEFQRLKGIWRLHGEMDIAYMLPEVRWIPGGAPLSRKEVMKAPPKELERIRRETEKTLRQYLSFTYAGKPLPWRIEFPDFDKKPFELPKENADWALMTVRLVVDEQTGPGELVVHWSKEERAELIILTEDSPSGEIVSISPGGKLTLLKQDAPKVFVKRPDPDHAPHAPKQDPKSAKTTDNKKPAVGGLQAFGSWVVSGFRHVLPFGLDHMLFIFGLFVAVLSLRPMWWQSLLFTLAHSLTLALCAFGWIALDAKMVEILIALSIAFIGIEDLCGLKVGKRRYVLVVLFGLVHGMGFANVLAEKIHGLDKAQLVKPLLGFNLGVEIAQIVVILLSAMLFALVPKKHKKTAQRIGAAIVALGGLAWLVLRAKDYF